MPQWAPAHAGLARLLQTTIPRRPQRPRRGRSRSIRSSSTPTCCSRPFIWTPIGKPQAREELDKALAINPSQPRGARDARRHGVCARRSRRIRSGVAKVLAINPATARSTVSPPNRRPRHYRFEEAVDARRSRRSALDPTSSRARRRPRHAPDAHGRRGRRAPGARARVPRRSVRPGHLQPARAARHARPVRDDHATATSSSAAAATKRR